MVGLRKGNPMGRRVDLVTHAHKGALGLGDRATRISFNTMGCTFQARDDNSDAMPTTHDTVDAIGGTSASSMDLGGGLDRARLRGGALQCVLVASSHA
ncbi:hypothetical protein GUJ93_ZPchr0013g35398 [Zizania palustris]|uniref:Uncharacterized protein n=1 Tax=Zizania palustris TaxID=103762 RepID=A0A8J5X568_ZIZPA|nr:hypothetical protein GUJ93_ZPchr0013g35398 [Zizania palustris]